MSSNKFQAAINDELLKAIEENNLPVVECLLRLGAGKQVRSFEPLRKASGNHDIMKLLVLEVPYYTPYKEIELVLEQCYNEISDMLDGFDFDVIAGWREHFCKKMN